MSPTPNKIAIEKANVKAPLMISASTMLRGTTTAESVTSLPVGEPLAVTSSKGPKVQGCLLTHMACAINS